MVSAGAHGETPNCENKASWEAGLSSTFMLSSLLTLVILAWGLREHLQPPVYTMSSLKGLTVWPM